MVIQWSVFTIISFRSYLIHQLTAGLTSKSHLALSNDCEIAWHGYAPFQSTFIKPIHSSGAPSSSRRPHRVHLRLAAQVSRRDTETEYLIIVSLSSFHMLSRLSNRWETTRNGETATRTSRSTRHSDRLSYPFFAILIVFSFHFDYSPFNPL